MVYYVTCLRLRWSFIFYHPWTTTIWRLYFLNCFQSPDKQIEGREWIEVMSTTIKGVFGLLSNSSRECDHCFVEVLNHSFEPNEVTTDETQQPRKSPYIWAHFKHCLDFLPTITSQAGSERCHVCKQWSNGLEAQGRKLFEVIKLRQWIPEIKVKTHESPY